MAAHKEVVGVYLKSYQNIIDARNTLYQKLETQAISLFVFLKKKRVIKVAPRRGYFDR